jgi:hypothetical protein
MTEKIPTMADVIARSCLMHPILFAEALEKDAKMRRDWVHGLPFDGWAKEAAHRRHSGSYSALTGRPAIRITRQRITG